MVPFIPSQLTDLLTLGWRLYLRLATTTVATFCVSTLTAVPVGCGSGLGSSTIGCAVDETREVSRVRPRKFAMRRWSFYTPV